MNRRNLLKATTAALAGLFSPFVVSKPDLRWHKDMVVLQDSFIAKTDIPARPLTLSERHGQLSEPL